MCQPCGLRQIGVGVVFAACLVSSSVHASAGVIEGTVLDRTGKPAGGALVWVARLQAGAPVVKQETVADDQGRFTFSVAVGTWLAKARRGEEGGALEDLSSVEVQEGRDTAPVIIRLDASSRLRGRLLDAENGKPVRAGRLALDDARIVTVDGEGRFEAPGLSMGAHEAFPLCAGFERKSIRFDTSLRPDAELEIKIPRAGKIVGRVTDEAGRPIPGACVGPNNRGNHFLDVALWEPCDADGRFSWDGASGSRTASLYASAPGFVAQVRQDLLVAVDEPAPELEFRLRAKPGPSNAANANPVQVWREVAGTVVGPDRKPITGASVCWGGDAPATVAPVTTDNHGRFRLPRVPDGSGVIVVMVPKLTQGLHELAVDGDEEIHFVLEKGEVVRGRVRDESGAPVEGVDVIPNLRVPRLRWRSGISTRALGVKTDAQGRFVLEGMPAELVFVTLLGKNLVPLRDRSLRPGDDPKNDVVLQGEGAIRGRVVDPRGAPVRNFRILLDRMVDDKDGRRTGFFIAENKGTGVSFTAADGTFVLSGFQLGAELRLSAIAESFGVGERDRVKSHSILHLPASGELTIKLTAPHSLRVKAVDAGGRPIEKASVVVIKDNLEQEPTVFYWPIGDVQWERSSQCRSSEDGKVEFPNLEYGRGTVIVRARGFAHRRLAWRNGERALEAELEPEAVVAGEVLDDDGQPVPDATVRLSSIHGDQIEVSVDPVTGRFVASELPSGTYNLRALVAGWDMRQLGREQFTLAPSEKIVEEIRLTKANSKKLILE